MFNNCFISLILQESLRGNINNFKGRQINKERPWTVQAEYTTGQIATVQFTTGEKWIVSG